MIYERIGEAIEATLWSAKAIAAILLCAPIVVIVAWAWVFGAWFVTL